MNYHFHSKEKFLWALWAGVLLWSYLLPLYAAPTNYNREPTFALIHSNLAIPSYTTPWSAPSIVETDGMGVVINTNPTYVLTSASLTQNAVSTTVVLMNNHHMSKKIPAQLIYTDPEVDLSIIQLDGLSNEDQQSITPIKLANEKTDETQKSIIQVVANVLDSSAAELLAIRVSPYRTNPHFRSREDLFLVLEIENTLKLKNGEPLIAGTPVLNKGNELIGLALSGQKNNASSIKLVPSYIIKQFIIHQRVGLSGFPNFGAKFESTTRELLNLLSCKEQGVYVSDVYMNMPANKARLQIGDIITAIDGYPVNSNGNYIDPTYGIINVFHLLRSKMPIEGFHTLTVFREGKTLSLRLYPFHQPTDRDLIPNITSTKPTPYFVLGGLVLMEGTFSYVMNWLKKTPSRALSLFYTFINQTKAEFNWREHIVYLGNILETSETNKPDEFEPVEVFEINDTPILSIKDVPRAIQKPILKNGKYFHFIRCKGAPGLVYLHAGNLEQTHKELATKYQINTFTNIETSTNR